MQQDSIYRQQGVPVSIRNVVDNEEANGYQFTAGLLAQGASMFPLQRLTDLVVSEAVDRTHRRVEG